MREEGRTIGVDVGQRRDYAAVAVVERVLRAGEWDGGVWAHEQHAELRVRHVERMGLGTPYVEVAGRVKEVVGQVGGGTVVVDATGVGGPVVEMMRRMGMGGRVMGVTITGGGGVRGGGVEYRVGKRELVMGMVVLLEKGEVRIASGMEWGKALVEEMGSVRGRGGAGGERYGAWGSGEHDDLVMAVALACWGMRRMYGQKASGRVGWCKREGVGW